MNDQTQKNPPCPSSGCPEGAGRRSARTAGAGGPSSGDSERSASAGNPPQAVEAGDSAQALTRSASAGPRARGE
jgi:hypothetical protein